MIWSLTYDRKPKYTFGGIKTVIETIIKNCVEVKENGSIIFRNEEIMKRKLLGNEELIKYGYILDGREREERFQRFSEWYKSIIEEKSGSIVIEEKYNTRRLFVEIIHLEEEIVKPEHRKKIEDFQKSFKYNKMIRIRYERPWVNRGLTNKIRDELMRTHGFTEIIEEIIIDNPEKEYNKESDDNDVSLYEELIGILTYKKKNKNSQ
jgi:hypothetical protein